MPKRIEYIEDGSWRDVLGPVWINGFASDDVAVGIREDFTELKADLATGDLADVYILDNEIVGENKEGAEMALEIRKKAVEADKEVLIITMLCSAPEAVRRTYGDRLDKEEIPIRFKLTDAPMIGFYIGRCIKEEKHIGFQEWLTSEGITTPKNTAEARDVQNAITGEVEDAEPGAFYLKPREFISLNREGIIRFMRPESDRYPLY